MQLADHQPSQSKIYRIVTCAFGVIFGALALAIVVFAEISLGSLIASVLVGGVGLDAIVCALRNKKSLLAKIGPLP